MKQQIAIYPFTQFFIASVMLFGLLASGQCLAECESAARLKVHAGHYAKKDFWGLLPKTKNWSTALRGLPRGGISAINIDTNGELNISFRWWEALPMACVHFKGNELWAKTSNDPALKWEGPFILVGLPYQDETIYFARIFGSNCYKSDKGEQWCFASDSIHIDTKQIKPKLVLPAHLGIPGTPSYGTPIQIEGESNEDLWVFVPTKDGWKVFQDTFEDVLGHKTIDPTKTRPWRELTRNQ